ncbi:MAG: DUF5011 domain-containing protein [Bacilli bacterium]|nr:DUF5011 domain-containing protein [Bacilli bacterium]MDD3304624.1 DUF5011 domain-containing protein [Bacilli bacterium]MDD4053537.1 DUF5011 domain-containing protein [Bacilli bacterium]MDD4411496.1 DUF5011 domain-containing protein [Bacilli bacterium]
MKKNMNDIESNVLSKIKKLFKSKETSKSKLIVSIILIAIMLTGSFIYVKNFYERKIYRNSRPVVEIVGDKHITINKGEKFEDPGVKAFDYLDKSLTKEVITQGKVDPNKEGTYYIYYSVENSRGIKSEQELRVVKVVKETNEDDDKSKGNRSVSPKNTKQLRIIIEEVVDEHKAELTQFGNDSCQMVDYLTPFIHNHYNEGEYPDREVLRPMVKEVLGVK